MLKPSTAARIQLGGDRAREIRDMLEKHATWVPGKESRTLMKVIPADDVALAHLVKELTKLKSR